MSEVIVGIRHNHLTRDVKPIGECPGCDTRERLLKEIEKLRSERRDLIAAVADYQRVVDEIREAYRE